MKTWSTLSMLQITKASEVVPISLYLMGTFFQFKFWNPNFSPNSSSTLNPLTIGPILWFLATFSFSFMVQLTLENPLRLFSSKDCEDDDGFKKRVLERWVKLGCWKQDGDDEVVCVVKVSSFAIKLVEANCEICSEELNWSVYWLKKKKKKSKWNDER